MDPANFVRERAILASVGGKLVQSHANALRGRWCQAGRRSHEQDALPNQFLEMGELTFDEARYLDTLPVVLDQQVLAGREAVDPVREALDERCRVGVLCGLLGDRLDDGELAADSRRKRFRF